MLIDRRRKMVQRAAAMGEKKEAKEAGVGR